jgi:DNA-directed RNA polymerase beta subunit
MPLEDKDRWYIAESYARRFSLLRNQIESYNNFINVSIHNIYKSKRISVTKNGSTCTYEINDIIVHKPTEIKLATRGPTEEVREISSTVPLFPKKCVSDRSTYSCNVTADIVMTLKIGEDKPIVKEFEKTHIISVPVMVLSDKCNLKSIFNYKNQVAQKRENIHDYGGYFVIRGNRKFLISQEKQLSNKILIFKDKKKEIIFAEIKSTCIERFHSKTIKVIYSTKNKTIGVSIPYIDSSSIPMGIVFNALGILDNQQIRKLVGYENIEALYILEKALESTIVCTSVEEALCYIGKKGRKYEREDNDNEVNDNEVETEDDEVQDDERKTTEDAASYTRHLFENELFPHLGPDFKLKSIFLGQAIGTLLRVVCGERECDDRDHFCNKILVNVDELLSTQLSSVVTSQMKKIERNIIQSLVSGASNLLAGHKIDVKKSSDNFLAAFNMNKWSGRINAQGICQMLEEYNPWGAIGNMRKMTTAINEEGAKVILPRRLHPSQWGRCCGYGTPEGKRCLTLDTYILTTNGNKYISYLRDGDEVFTVQTKPKIKINKSKIYDFFVTKKVVYKLTISNGCDIKASADHPFYTSVGWVEVKNLVIGMYVLWCGIKGFEYIKLIEIKQLNEQTVADFTTESDDHSFIANGFVTHNCGFIKCYALLAGVTKENNARIVREYMRDIDCILPLGDVIPLGYAIVYIDYVPIGVTNNPTRVVEEVKKIRRFNQCREISVRQEDDGNVSVLCMAGRLNRPLIIVENNKPLVKKYSKSIKSGNIPWDDFFDKGLIEYIDAHEEESCITALSFQDIEDHPEKKFTHCEIHACFTMGVDVTIVPYPNNNTSPRMIYESNMSKQGLGMSADHGFPCKGRTHILAYPGKQICYTKSSKLIGYDRLPTGYPVKIAICPFQGLDQEDAIVINKDSVDRGLLNSIELIVYETTIKGGEKLEIPTSEDCNNVKGNFSKIGENGIIKYKTQVVRKRSDKNEIRYTITKVRKGDALIAKTQTLSKKLRKSKQNMSVLYDKDLEGTVYAIDKGFDSDGYEYVKVIISIYRIPVCGDKFTSLISQKGICGHIAPSIDLPTMIDGSCPDICINPSSQPSRLTLGMLKEIIVSKCLCVSTAKMRNKNIEISGDGTPYENNCDMETIYKYLKETGNHKYGEDFMYDGMTGEPLKALIFNGVCYYQRLKHLVEDKIHVRTRGPKSMLFNQPTEGKKLNGGLKVGEMERDILITQGVAAVTKDRMMEQSDKFFIWACNACGLPAIHRGEEGAIENECKICDTGRYVSKVPIPYGTKLLLQEFSAMNMICRIFKDGTIKPL